MSGAAGDGAAASPRAVRFARAGGLGMVLAALRACLDAASPGGAFSFDKDAPAAAAPAAAAAAAAAAAPPPANYPLARLPWRRGVRQAAALLAAAVAVPGGWRGASMEERVEAVCLPVDLLKAMVGDGARGGGSGEAARPAAAAAAAGPPSSAAAAATTTTTTPPPPSSSSSSADTLEGVAELIALLASLATVDGAACRMMTSHGGLGALAAAAGEIGRASCRERV